MGSSGKKREAVGIDRDLMVLGQLLQGQSDKTELQIVGPNATVGHSLGVSECSVSTGKMKF